MRRSIFRGKCIDGEKAGTWVDGYQSAADYIASGSGDFLTEYLVDRKTVTECVGYHMGYEGDIFTYEKSYGQSLYVDGLPETYLLPLMYSRYPNFTGKNTRSSATGSTIRNY